MRPVTRQSARLANCTCQCRRALQIKHFHSSVNRASEPRVPAPPHSSPPASAVRERQEHSVQAQEEGQRKQDAATFDAEDNGVRPASELRRSSFRKATRQRRTAEIPKPPPVPIWFLEKNVFLSFKQMYTSRDIFSEAESTVIQCEDRETKQVVFELPYYQPKLWLKLKADEFPAPRNEENSSEPSAETVATTKDEPEKSPANTRSPGTNFFDSTESISKALDKSAQELLAKLADLDKQLKRFNGPRPDSEEKGDTIKSGDTSKDQANRVEDFEIPPMQYRVEMTQSAIQRWSFLEAEASIRAAFALAGGKGDLSSFAASRVDVSLHCTDVDDHDRMDRIVTNLACITSANVIKLQPNDLADLTAEYVGRGSDAPGSYANLGYDVYEDYQSQGLRYPLSKRNLQKEESVAEVDEDEGELPANAGSGRSASVFASISSGALKDLSRLFNAPVRLANVSNAAGADSRGHSGYPVFLPESTNKNVDPTGEESYQEDVKLNLLFEQLIESAAARISLLSKPSKPGQVEHRVEDWMNVKEMTPDSLFDDWMIPKQWRAASAAMLVTMLREGKPYRPTWRLTAPPAEVPSEPWPINNEAAGTIVYIPDLQDLCDLPAGQRIVTALLKVVQSRRRKGERIVIVGTTVRDAPSSFVWPEDVGDGAPFRSISIPPDISDKLRELFIRRFEGADPGFSYKSQRSEALQSINFRNIQSMLTRLRPDFTLDLSNEETTRRMEFEHAWPLKCSILSQDEVQRLILVAIGLQQGQAPSAVLQPLHLGMANAIIVNADTMLDNHAKHKERMDQAKAKSKAELGLKKAELTGMVDIDGLKKNSNSHEARLLGGVIRSKQIKTGFGDVHTPPENIEALRTLTSLALQRPDAFKYGVLASDRLTGLLLYGPPGTGKTLLAKAVAKESGATVLEVSGAQIYEKYVGEGEKMVRAVFSLARKLSPCVVFMDEADAIFGSRSSASSRNTHRDIINQFLREWDGMDDHGVFIMVATNRPFDLDDAVLRRLPRRLLVDLPTTKDREAILGIHLRSEALDSTISLAQLAEQTPLYSGSDLKNLAVAAALAAVREENDEKQKNPDYNIPEKRILNAKHFEKALAEISASISEDMATLRAIRKFDEQFGDRRGRRSKSGVGFGVSEGKPNESAARVRQSVLPPIEAPGSAPEVAPPSP